MEQLEKEKFIDDIIVNVGKTICISNIDDLMTGNADERTIREALLDAAELINNDKPLEGNLKHYLVNSLLKIINGCNPAVALSLKSNSRRKNDYGSERVIAFRVAIAIEKEGFKTQDAINIVANEYHKSSESIKKIYYRHKQENERKVLEYITKRK